MSLRTEMKRAVNDLWKVRQELLQRYPDFESSTQYNDIIKIGVHLEMEELCAAAFPSKCPKRWWTLSRDHKWTYGVDVCGTRPFRKCVDCEQRQVWMEATKKWMNTDESQSD